MRTLQVALAVLVAAVAADPCQDMSDSCSFVGSEGMFRGSKVCLLDNDCETTKTILIPDGYTVDGQDHAITAREDADDDWKGAILKNSGTVAHVKNIKVTTDDLACQGKSGDDRLRGILFEGASGSITHVEAININKGICGSQEGNGIEARASTCPSPCSGCINQPKLDVEISENLVEYPQKTGIVVNCDMNGNVHNNNITGLGPVDYIAQNGIQFGYGAKGRIAENMVTGSWYTRDNWGSTGILMFETSDGIMASRNTLLNNQVGIAAESWSWICFTGANKHKIINNDVGNSQTGISVFAFDWSYTCASATGVSADDNKVTNNRIWNNKDQEDQCYSNDDVTCTGIEVGSWSDCDPDSDCPPPYPVTARNNKITANKIDGFEEGINTEGDEGTKEHGNHFPFKPFE